MVAVGFSPRIWSWEGCVVSRRLNSTHKLSVEKIPFIVLDSMLVEHRPIFVLERSHTMMFTLAADVTLHFGHKRFADGERCITVLPPKPCGIAESLFDPR